jgi:hypothetical protein
MAIIYDGLKPQGMKISMKDLYTTPLIKHEEIVLNTINDTQEILLGGWTYDYIKKLTPILIRCIKNVNSPLYEYKLGKIANNSLLKLNLFEKLINKEDTGDDVINNNDIQFLKDINIGTYKLLSNIIEDSKIINTFRDNQIENFINFIASKDSSLLKSAEFSEVYSYMYIMDIAIKMHFDTFAKMYNIKKTPFILNSQKNIRQHLFNSEKYNNKRFSARNKVMNENKDIFTCKDINENDKFKKIGITLRDKYEITYVDDSGDELCGDEQ